MMDILEIMKTNPGTPNGGNVFFSSPTQQHPQPSPPLPFHQDLLNLLTTFIFVMAPSGIGDVPLVFL